MTEFVRAALQGLGAYAAAGLLFAVVFHCFGLHRLDAATRGAGVVFRLLITPGLVALWPLVGLRWLRAIRGRPFPGEPEAPVSPRRLRAAHGMIWKALAVLAPMGIAVALWSRPEDPPGAPFDPLVAEPPGPPAAAASF